MENEKERGIRMKAERLEVLKEVAKRLEVDLEKGVILNRNPKSIGTHGYKVISIWYKGRPRVYSYHEVIAYMGGLDLLGNSINHIDGNKMNNSISNLEAIPLADNTRHQWETGLVKPYEKVSKEQRKEIRALWESGKYTQVKLGKMYGVSNTTISCIVNKKLVYKND